MMRKNVQRGSFKLISQGDMMALKEKKKKKRRIPLSTSQEGGRRLRDCRSPGWVIWIVPEIIHIYRTPVHYVSGIVLGKKHVKSYLCLTTVLRVDTILVPCI